MRRTLTWLIAGGLLTTPVVAGADNPAPASAKAEAALEVDILLALDLPLVAHEARAAGIAKEEVELALSSARDGGLSAADTSEIVAAEVEETNKAGKAKENFGQWVRQQVAAGTKGPELAQAIRERKAELAASAAAAEADIDAKLAKLREERQALRAKLREKRKELVTSGQKLVVRGKTENAARQRALLTARAELLAAAKDLSARQRPPVKGPERNARVPAQAKTSIEARAAKPEPKAPDNAAKTGEAKRAEVAQKNAAEKPDVKSKPESPRAIQVKPKEARPKAAETTELKPSSNQAQPTQVQPTQAQPTQAESKDN